MEEATNLGHCPRCDSLNREKGMLYRSGTNERSKFRADDAAPLSFKKDVAAVACLKCGFIELYLEEHELEKPKMW